MEKLSLTENSNFAKLIQNCSRLTCISDPPVLNIVVTYFNSPELIKEIKYYCNAIVINYKVDYKSLSLYNYLEELSQPLETSKSLLYLDYSKLTLTEKSYVYNYLLSFVRTSKYRRPASILMTKEEFEELNSKLDYKKFPEYTRIIELEYPPKVN